MNIFNEAKLLQFRVYLESMLAENKYREFSGKSLAYTEENFDNLAKEIENFINKNQNKTQEKLINKYKQTLNKIEEYCVNQNLKYDDTACDILNIINEVKD